MTASRIRRIALLALVGAFTFSGNLQAQAPPKAEPPTAEAPKTDAPKAQNEPALEQIKKCVVFLIGNYELTRIEVQNGVPTQREIQMQSMGTGFFIGVPEPRLGSDQNFVFVVTNKHVIREPDAAGKPGLGPYFKALSARINTREAKPDGTQYITIPLTVVTDRGDLTWLVDPDDDSVDLAVTPIRLMTDVVDTKWIGTDALATRKTLADLRITENDEVLFTGLFAWHLGAMKNYPIVRHGKLARISQERIPLDRTDPTRTVDVHLADVMSFGGNSGSPVFLRIGGVRDDGTVVAGYSYPLLGVMQGFFPEGLDVAIQIAELHGVAAQNSGIAAVIPAEKITNILDSPRGKAFVERSVGAALLARGGLQGAEKCLITAIRLLETSSPHHSDLADCLGLYAMVLRKTNRFGLAALADRRATLIRSAPAADRFHPRM
jgi:hypothetical protein